MYLLDTNVLSETRRMHRSDPAVWAWSQAVPADLLYISAVTVLEIEQGVLRVERRDAQQALLFANWLHKRILPQFEGRILATQEWPCVAPRCTCPIRVPSAMR